MEKKIYSVLLTVVIVIAAICVILVGVTVDMIQKVDYHVVEMENGETVVFVRPIVISKDNTSLYYKPIDEEIRIYSSNVGAVMENVDIFWLDN